MTNPNLPCDLPKQFVDAFVQLTTIKGFYYGLALIVLLIVCWRPPWRCRKCRKGDS